MERHPPYMDWRGDEAMAAMVSAILYSAPIGAEYVIERPEEEGAQEWELSTYRKVGADSWELVSHESDESDE